MPKSALLTKEVAQQGIAMVRPVIESFMSSGVTDRKSLHIVVLDPSIKFGAAKFEEAILAEDSIGKDHWELDFENLARKKAAVSWEHQLDSHIVQQQQPYLYHTGDNKYAGAVVHFGLIVSTAGVQWYYDEMFAALIAAACRGLVLAEMEKVIKEDGRHFI